MTLKKNILSWLIALGVSLGVIAVIILSVFMSKACAEIVTENRDGVIYIYNKKPEPMSVEVVEESSSTKGGGSEVEFKPRTREEEALISAEDSIKNGESFGAYCDYEKAGDYDRAMAMLLEATKQSEQDKKYSDAAWGYQRLGDFNKFKEMKIMEALESEVNGHFRDAADSYARCWDREKVKEMYLKQQQKVRNEIISQSSDK